MTTFTRRFAPETPEISVVVPLFNEEQNIPELHRRLTAALTALEARYELVFVNDGSRDATAQLLEHLASADACVAPVHFSRNFGHQAAVTAGIAQAQGQAVIVMDGDLQDPPEVLGEFIAAWRRGYDVVYAVRTKRKEHLLKRAGYAVFYRLLRGISDLEIPLDSGDFCLMDRTVVAAMERLPERQRFVRGLRCFVGFRQLGLRYERAARNAGEPKYTFRALVRLAMDGLVNFSGFPLNLIAYLAAALLAVAAPATLWAALASLAEGTAPAGWVIATLALLWCSGLQLLSLAIVGEYVRRIFVETKGRPTYIIDERPQRLPERHTIPARERQEAAAA